MVGWGGWLAMAVVAELLVIGISCCAVYRREVKGLLVTIRDRCMTGGRLENHHQMEAVAGENARVNADMPARAQDYVNRGFDADEAGGRSRASRPGGGTPAGGSSSGSRTVSSRSGVNRPRGGTRGGGSFGASSSGGGRFGGGRSEDGRPGDGRPGDGRSGDGVGEIQHELYNRDTGETVADSESNPQLHSSERDIRLTLLEDDDPGEPDQDPAKTTLSDSDIEEVVRRDHSYPDACQLASYCSTTDQLIKKLEMSQSMITSLERDTVGQANNPLWLKVREGRLTASNFYEIHTKVESLMRKPNIDYQSLVNSLLNPKSIMHLPQIAKGIRDEKMAIDKAAEIIMTTHDDVTVCECGLFIDKRKPYLGASPDRIVHCSCCEHSHLLEIKCPSTAIDSLPYLCPDLTLKVKSNYYGQIQGQMAIANIKSTFFCVYTEDQTIIQHIGFNEEFWRKMEKNLVHFYHNYMGPALIAEQPTSSCKRPRLI